MFIFNKPQKISYLSMFITVCLAHYFLLRIKSLILFLSKVFLLKYSIARAVLQVIILGGYSEPTIRGKWLILKIIPDEHVEPVYGE